MSYEFLEDLKRDPVFYRSNFRRLTIISLILMLVIMAEMIFILRTHLMEPPRTYFATTTTGKVVELFPRTTPKK